MARPTRLPAALALALAMALSPARLASAAELPPPGDAAWQPVEFPRIDRHTRYEAEPGPGLDGRIAWHATSACSASAMAVSLEEEDLDATPVLTWRWRLERGLDNEREQSKAGDDFAARVYVMFRFRAERASWWERARRSVASALYGRELPGHTLNYVWTSHTPPGTSWTSPYTDYAHLVAVRRGPSEGWHEESVDLLADYERLVGAPPPPALALAVMSDSDDTCGRAEAWLADFRLDARRGP